MRPRISAPSQVRQTFSMIGWSTSHAASNVKISAEKRVFRTKRLADPRSGSDRPFVDAARDPVVIWPRLPEVLLKEGKRPLSEVESGFDPEPIHLRCCRRPNAVELLDRQSFDEGRPRLRCNDEEAIGLTMIRGELGEEFVVGDTRGSC